MDVVSYTNIIYMILLYDTPHYDQPNWTSTCLNMFLLRWQTNLLANDIYSIY
jgi:hypothetical protein